MSGKTEREREFHNAVFKDHSRSGTWKFYEVTAGSRGRYVALLDQQPPNSRVLEIGCGPTSLAVHLGHAGCQVVGVDIADEAIRQSQERVAEAGLADRVVFERMDAERLEFPANSFDLVCCAGVVHHLDTDTAFRETARVLRPEGRAVFLEPLGHNPAINSYRRRTPHLRTVDEHPLRRADLKLAERHFSGIRVEFFELAAIAAVATRRMRAFPRILDGLEQVDRVLLSHRSPLRYWAWTSVMELTRPH